MSRKHPWLVRSLVVTLPLFAIVFVVQFYFSGQKELVHHEHERIGKIESFRKLLLNEIGHDLSRNRLPLEVTLPFPDEGEKNKLSLSYTIDGDIQKEAEKLLKSYKPDYGAIVAMDATTGKILAMASFEKNEGEAPQNLALRGSYPAASVFKIVTATAAVDKYSISPDTIIMFNGSNHTLYKRNVLNANVNKWTRKMNLREAFARSVNTVFARLSFEKLQPADIREYAVRFGFNTQIQSDLPFDPGFTLVPDDDDYHLAEIVSGFNRMTKMSPIQGAMIASSIADDGVMRVPYIVEKATNEKGEVVFQSEPVTAAVTMSKGGAEKLKDLMEATVTSGTGRKSFRQLIRNRKFTELQIGGKTGSLTGTDPKGKVDWFVGYAINEKSKIAVAAITVNIKKWTVKSTFLAQSIFRKYYGDQFSRENEKFLSQTAISTAQEPAN